MNKTNNISYTTGNSLCTGCGICEDVCPRQSIKIELINGEHRPILNQETCLGDKCGRCLKACPGIGVNLAQIAKKVFDSEQIIEDKYIGRYLHIYTGYALDDDIRYHSASGGIVSQFLIFLLEKGYIDGAVVTGFADDHITPASYIAHTREEILAARSSKYCPVSLNKMGNDIIDDGGSRYVIVGLPCHIQGFRKRSLIDKRFRERVVGFFSIYCSSGRTFYAQDYLFHHYEVKKENISYFAFRDNGCLGYLTIKQKTIDEDKKPLVGTKGTDYRELKIPFSQYYGPMLRSFFKSHRCMTCIDHYGELADVCFGDIHINPFSDDHIGISSWITRNEYWDSLFIEAEKCGYIKMSKLDANTLNESQKAMLYPKKRRAKAAMTIDRMMGRKVAMYDTPLDKPTIKDYLTEIICSCQRFVGRNKSLWFIIDFLNRDK